MDLTAVQTLFKFMTDNIFYIMYLLAAFETYLVIAIFFMMKSHESKLLDAADNLLKGFEDAPDKDSTQHVHEKIQTALHYISNKIMSDSSTKEIFKKNAGKINERPAYTRNYKIEIFASIMSTVVQVFPLLGILGTILAIAGTAFEPGAQLEASKLTSAFVLAMDTTILGITFSVIFMIVESTFQPKIERVISESHEYRQVFSSIYYA